MTRFRIALFAAVALIAALSLALPALAKQEATKITTVTVTAGKPSEFKFRLSTLKAKDGIVVFKVTNSGALPHDFKISGRKTRLLSPGESDTLRVTIRKPGKYQFLCTVSGHAAAGMKGLLTVT